MASQASGVFGSMIAASQKPIEFTSATFFAYILPPFVCQYLMGVLVQLSGTRSYRLLLLSITVWLAWRAALVDASRGDPANAQANIVLTTQMCSLSTRSATWAFARVRYQRHSPLNNRNKSGSESIYAACWDTWDLLINPRGIGWNWPRGFVVPRPTIKTDSRVVFVMLSSVAVAFHALMFDACLQSIRFLSPETFGSLNGGSLFDKSLPPAPELLRALAITSLAAPMVYNALEYTYQILAIVCVILLHQHPSQWPPLFDSPWLSSSLGDLWGRRWHQMMRDMLLTLGGQPFGYFFGRLGSVIGVFLVSGIFHDIELRSSGRGGNSVIIIGFWTMNGVGIVLERVWTRVTGRPVGGFWGRAWIAGWLLLWGVPTVNEYAKAAKFADMALPGRLEPSLALVRLFFPRG